MSDFYERMADTALRLITDKGIPCVIKSPPQQGGFDPGTGLPLPNLPPTEQVGVCVVLNYSDVIRNAPESLVRQGDKKLLLSAKGIDMPQIGATVSVLDSDYMVVAVKDTQPANTPLVYEVHGRE